jgi:putative oxidoreductase
MKATTTADGVRIDAALAVLRAVIGGIFIAHGAQKLFVFGLGGITGGFEQAGIPLAGLAAPLVSFTELLGGGALVAGLLTRFAAVGLGVVMLGAIGFVHAPNGFFLPDGIEFALALLGSNVALVLTGAGAYSLDAVLARRREPVPSRASKPAFQS